MASRNSKGYPARHCAICGLKILWQDRLCAQHMEEYKDHLTEPWLRAIIAYDNYALRVELRDVGKVRSLDTLAGRI